MKILVTGAAGLIGSHLVDLLLDRGDVVVGLDDLTFGNRENLKNAFTNPRFEFRQQRVQTMDITNDNFDVIFHLASLKKPLNASLFSSDVMKGNYEMIVKLNQIAQHYNSHLIFASTSDVYGNSTSFEEDEPITIGPPTNERYSYSLSKLFGEQHLLNNHHQCGLATTVFRIFGCASPRASRTWSGGHVPLFIDKALKGEDIIIHGDGLQTRSICHAIDVARGLTSSLDNLNFLNGHIINIGTDQQTTVRYVAEYILDKVGSRSKLMLVDRETVFGNYREVLVRYANTAKAKKLLNFSIRYSTEQVIDEIIMNHELYSTLKNEKNSSYYSN